MPSTRAGDGSSPVGGHFTSTFIEEISISTGVLGSSNSSLDMLQHTHWIMSRFGEGQ